MTETHKQPAEKILEELMMGFKCEACRKNLHPPVRMCKGGHNFCDVCKTGSNCPVCKVEIKEEVDNVQHADMAKVC